jgi:hypothetical protein
MTQRERKRSMGGDAFSSAEVSTSPNGLASARRKNAIIASEALERTERLAKRLEKLSEPPGAASPPSKG